MSVRPAKLCDIPLPTYGSDKTQISDPCSELAAATCVLCDRDICLKHAMHPQRGLVLKLESWRSDTSGNPPRDVPYQQNQNDAAMGNVVWPNVRISVCRPCRDALSPPSHYGKDHVQEVLNGIVAEVIAHLRAKLTDLSLKPK